ncbi:MAG TPA: hypothetical protein VGC97_05630 [Pyrinomonadaceae bacterium]|jgi:hypothetical protein
MASIKPITLTIVPNPNNGKFIVNVNYVVSASPNDVATEQNYREVCQLIGDDTPGDGTDDIIKTLRDGTLVFDGIFSHLTRNIQLEMNRSDLDEDRGLITPEADEIRARVTLTPIPATLESNQIVLPAIDPVNH